MMGINKIIHEHWRDWAAVVYLFLCVVDFFIAPLMWNIGMTMIIDDDKNKKNVREEKAKASIGGSMVFIEKKQMVWKGDEDESKLKQPKT